MAVIEKARIFLRYHTDRLHGAANLPKPKGAIFISAGFDASEHEGSGMQRHSVNVPTEFYARFTRDIVSLAQEQGTAVDGRVISVLEGGYSDKALISGVLSHISGLCHREQDPGAGLAAEMSRLTVGGGLSGLPESGSGLTSGHPTVPNVVRYNPEWWTSENLDALVELLHPTGKLPAHRDKLGLGRAGAYSSPTHASIMKQVDLTKVHRSGPSWTSTSRAPTPPPPTVHWATARTEACHLANGSQENYRGKRATCS